jgi:ABC-type multidrug transport system fused ATPase/permease subunit
LYPQRRRLLLAVGCSLALALSFAASLGAIVPILRLIMADAGPRAALLKMAADHAWSADIDIYNPLRHGSGDRSVPDNALIVNRLEPESQWHDQDILPQDILVPVADIDAVELLGLLSAGSQETELAVLAQDAVDLRRVVMQPTDLSFSNGFLVGMMRSFADWLPTDGGTDSRRRTLIVVFAGVFVMVIFSGICRFIAEFTVVVASNRAVMDMRRHMYRTIMYLPMTWFGRHLSETMSRVVTDFKDIERGYRALFGKLTTEPIKVAVVLALAIMVDWRITSFSLIAGVLGGGIVWVLGKKIRKANRKLLAGYAQMMGVLNATLSGMRVVRAYNKQTFERRRMWQAERRLLHQLLRIGRFEAMTGPLLEIMGVSIIMFGTVWLADHVFSGELKVDMFVLLVGFLVAIFDSIRKISAVFPRLARADGAAQRVFEMMDRPIETPELGISGQMATPTGSITVENLTFTYPEADHAALDHITFTARIGQRIALVGPNGSGKTTMIGLLLRFFEPDSGRILVDGADIRDFSIASLRSHIGLVTQDAVVFAATVHDNIAYGYAGADRETVVKAAKQAEAHDFIERLPQGYDTILGEFGATLSGGQRQRLALARAVFRDSPVFIFDEATSQIDAESERKIHHASLRFMQGRTSFVIAHRLATITDSDLIVVFDQGRIVNTGTHEELLARCELYATLFRSHALP